MSKVVIVFALLASVSLAGCAATLTGAYVMPRPSRVATPVATGQLPTVFVTTEVSFTANAEVAPGVCLRGSSSAACKA